MNDNAVVRNVSHYEIDDFMHNSDDDDVNITALEESDEE